ncbi:unnamed protein product [Sympodiomycopsis kandeliae]
MVQASSTPLKRLAPADDTVLATLYKDKTCTEGEREVTYAKYKNAPNGCGYLMALNDYHSVKLHAEGYYYQDKDCKVQAPDHEQEKCHSFESGAPIQALSFTIQS